MQNIKQFIRVSMILCLGFGATLPVSAIEPGWYIGGGLGDADVDRSGFDDDTAFKLFGGYKSGGPLAVEAAYVDLGEFDGRGAEFDVDGFQLAALGHLPLGEKFSLFGKGGVYFWDSDASGAGDDDGTDITFGFGVLYATEKWGIRVEWERFDGTDPDDIDLLSVNGVLLFNNKQ
jgi:OOP family OmpA-OmpF porin